MMAKKRGSKKSDTPSTSVEQVTLHRRPSPLSAADHDQLRTQAVAAMFSTPFPDSHPSRSLADAPHFATHRATIEAALAPYLDALADHILGLLHEPNRSDELHQSFLTPEDHLDRFADAVTPFWVDLWQPQKPPCKASYLRVYTEELCEHLVYHLLYPPFSIPPATRLAMFDRALDHAANTTLPDGSAFTDSAFYADPDRLALMEDAFRQTADRHLMAAQKRLPLIQDPHFHITKGNKTLPTFAAERDRWHSVKRLIANNRKGSGHEPANLRDEYALFASLEEMFGTAQTGDIGAALWGRFVDSLEKQITRYKKTHGLDKPYHHKGKAPQLD